MKKQDHYSPSREVDALISYEELNTMTWDTPTMEQIKARAGGRILVSSTDYPNIAKDSPTGNIQFSVAPEGNRHERRKATSNKVRRNKRKHQRISGVPR